MKIILVFKTIGEKGRKHKELSDISLIIGKLLHNYDNKPVFFKQKCNPIEGSSGCEKIVSKFLILDCKNITSVAHCIGIIFYYFKEHGISLNYKSKIEKMYVNIRVITNNIDTLASKFSNKKIESENIFEWFPGAKETIPALQNVSNFIELLKNETIPKATNKRKRGRPYSLTNEEHKIRLHILEEANMNYKEASAKYNQQFNSGNPYKKFTEQAYREWYKDYNPNNLCR